MDILFNTIAFKREVCLCLSPPISKKESRDFPMLTGLLFFTILHYVLAFAAIVLFYLYYTKPDNCTEHKFFISFNLIVCVIVSVVSILPKVQVSLVNHCPDDGTCQPHILLKWDTITEFNPMSSCLGIYIPLQVSFTNLFSFLKSEVSALGHV